MIVLNVWGAIAAIAVLVAVGIGLGAWLVERFTARMIREDETKLAELRRAREKARQDGERSRAEAKVLLEQLRAAAERGGRVGPPQIVKSSYPGACGRSDCPIKTPHSHVNDLARRLRGE